MSVNIEERKLPKACGIFVSSCTIVGNSRTIYSIFSCCERSCLIDESSNRSSDKMSILYIIDDIARLRMSFFLIDEFRPKRSYPLEWFIGREWTKERNRENINVYVCVHSVCMKSVREWLWDGEKGREKEMIYDLYILIGSKSTRKRHRDTNTFLFPYSETKKLSY